MDTQHKYTHHTPHKTDAHTQKHTPRKHTEAIQHPKQDNTQTTRKTNNKHTTNNPQHTTHKQRNIETHKGHTHPKNTHHKNTHTHIPHSIQTKYTHSPQGTQNHTEAQIALTKHTQKIITYKHQTHIKIPTQTLNTHSTPLTQTHTSQKYQTRTQNTPHMHN